MHLIFLLSSSPKVLFYPENRQLRHPIMQSMVASFTLIEHMCLQTTTMRHRSLPFHPEVSVLASHLHPRFLADLYSILYYIHLCHSSVLMANFGQGSLNTISNGLNSEPDSTSCLEFLSKQLSLLNLSDFKEMLDATFCPPQPA